MLETLSKITIKLRTVFFESVSNLKNTLKHF